MIYHAGVISSITDLCIFLSRRIMEEYRIQLEFCKIELETHAKQGTPRGLDTYIQNRIPLCGTFPARGLTTLVRHIDYPICSMYRSRMSF